VPLYRDFAGLDSGMARLPDESTILRFRHLLEAHGLAAQMRALVNEILVEKGLMLKTGSVVVTALIPAPSSTKNNSGKRDPEMRQTQKGGNWYFGMKAHIGVDAESGHVHIVIGTAANVHDITAAEALVRGEETDVYVDAGYQGIEKRCETDAVRWHVAMRPGKRRKLDVSVRLDAIYDQIERLKAGVRAKVEHPFRVLKRQFAYTKTRYRGLAKNTAQITTLFALGNLWMAHRSLRGA
jgi:transposase, IS5 family